jgi:hypothetical protein
MSAKPRSDWRANFNRRFNEWCRERGEPQQQTEVGRKAAASIAARAERSAKGRKKSENNSLHPDENEV